MTIDQNRGFTETELIDARNSLQAAGKKQSEIVLEGHDLGMYFGEKCVLDGIDVQVRRGEILAIVGGSGSGKSTLMRQLALLQTPTSGTVTIFGADTTKLNEFSAIPLRRRLGVMFQHGALFGDQTVLQNICLPLQEHTELKQDFIEQIAMLKIALVGLAPDVAALYPNQLSGGMRKRAAVARGIAMDPEILFLDEPSSGLDPISADEMDTLVLQLKTMLGLTIILVTHDMDSLWRVADRILLLGDARVAAQGSIQQLMRSDNTVAKQFFHGRRGRVAGEMYD
jgi:phospholipid/cholesterol/gamma-HCH transport system ATP-binding protein